MNRISSLLRRLWWVTLLLAVLVQPSAAHGYLVRAIPEDRAVLDRAPTRVQYWFSEPLEREFSTINIRDQTGEVVASGGLSETDNTLLTARLPADLPDGAYVVELRPAFASDGHVVAESRVFFVGEEVGGVAGQAATDRAIPLEVLWRSIVLTSSMLLFGALTLYALVLVPAWGSREHRAGLLPPRVMRRLNIVIGFALLAAFLGNGLALIQQTMTFFSIGFAQALDPNFWSLVRIGSRFGDIWNARMFFLGLVGVCFLASLYLRGRQPETVRPFLVASAWVMALVLGSFSVLSHAAGSLLWPWVGITVDWLHTLGVGFWAGGLAALVLVLPSALRPYSGDDRRRALLAVLRRFSPVAAGAVVLVIATGIYSASNWIYDPADLTQTPFGLSLLVKTGLVLILVGLGALHHAALRPERYERLDALTARVRDFTGTLRLEAVFVVLVLAAAGLLSATPVPVPSFAEREVEAPRTSRQVDDVTVTMSLSPGGPGVNTYDVVLSRGGAALDGYDVRLTTINPARDVRSLPQPVEAVDQGLYATAKDTIDEAGGWWTVVDLTAPDGAQRRAAFAWDIRSEAAVIQSVDPNALNVLALIGVVLAVGVAVSGPVQRTTRHLEINTFTVTTAAAATVATVVLLAFGLWVVQENRQRYAETLNPPPEVINPVLPDQASVERGETLYIEHCITWQSESRDFADLRERLPRMRDDALYAVTVEGWRDLPPCEGDLADSARWDIVNYVRTLGM